MFRTLCPFYYNPALGGSIIKSLRSQKKQKKNSPDILNDPLLTSPNSQGKRGTKLPQLLQVPSLLQILLTKLRPHLLRGTIPAGTTFSQPVCPCYQSQVEHYLV